MFARRPRYDDTFGERMDLGADRIDPMAMRPAPQLRVKETLLIERPGSIFGGCARRETDPLKALRARPKRAPKAPATAPRSTSAPRDAAPVEGPRTFEGLVRTIWQRLSATQRIALFFLAGWFLLATGLWVVAAVIAVVWFTRRKRAG